jgi:hypothetical protein
MNKYIQSSCEKFGQYLNEVKTVVPADEYFDMNEFADSSRQSKPKIYISPEEVIQVHKHVLAYLDELDVSAEDPLRITLNELGPAPKTTYGGKQAGSEIVLELKDRFAKVDGEDFNVSRL